MRSMRIALTLTLTALVALALTGCKNQPTPAASGGATTLTWQTDLPQSLQLAEQEGKLVLVDFYADWCGYCKKLDAETFPDPAVAAVIAERFIPVKVNGDEDRDAAAKYQVTGYPTIVILNHKGEQVSQIVGFLPPREFTAKLAEVPTQTAP